MTMEQILEEDPQLTPDDFSAWCSRLCGGRDRQGSTPPTGNSRAEFGQLDWAPATRLAPGNKWARSRL